MSALPNARSHGLSTTGGGALALTGMSAAKAEPEIIASAVAAKTNFFMTIPITFQNPSRLPDAPRTDWLVNSLQSGSRGVGGGAKKFNICRIFLRVMAC